MADEPEVRTLKEKLLFYTTAFFILLGTFSLFAFLFLVPFIIDPAFTTIFMQFDEVPAICETVETRRLDGVKNCSWASCREGCTKDLFTCVQIRVNYRLKPNLTEDVNSSTILVHEERGSRNTNHDYNSNKNQKKYNRDNNNAIKIEKNQSSKNDINANNIINNINNRRERLFPNYDYTEENTFSIINKNSKTSIIKETILLDATKEKDSFFDMSDLHEEETLDEEYENSTWFFIKARLFPNVKGCGYPPALNCTIWLKKYINIGSNFSCYYSKVDPGLVISDLDMWQNTLNLVYSMAIPIPSFIISVIYLAFAYFKIYNEDEEAEPLDKNAEDMAEDNEADGTCDEICVDVVIPNGVTPLTPNSDINSFGHQLKVKMADEMSRESLDGGIVSYSASIQGNMSKTMTTSISTPPGPTAAV